MSSASALPIIDISPFLASDELQWPPNDAQLATSRAIHAACRQHGFFYLTGLGLSADELQDILETARAFFELPVSKKELLSIRSKTNGTDGARGWQGLKENVTQNKPDYHEGWDLYKPVEEDPSLPLHGRNQWPSEEDAPQFRAKFEAWIETMLRLGKALVSATGIGLGMDEAEVENLLALVSDSFWVLRAIFYPPLPANHDGVSCGAHCDYGFYTLLHCTSQPGSLQVYDAKKLTWIDANPMPDTFVINIGDMWSTLSNGLYRSTLHRVVHKSRDTRISIPFFYEPNWDAEIRPLDAALRIQENESLPIRPTKQACIYGEHLTRKVAGNFGPSSKTKSGRY